MILKKLKNIYIYLSTAIIHWWCCILIRFGHTMVPNKSTLFSVACPRLCWCWYIMIYHIWYETKFTEMTISGQCWWRCQLRSSMTTRLFFTPTTLWRRQFLYAQTSLEPTLGIAARRVACCPWLTLDRSQSLFYFVRQEKTNKLARLVDTRVW